MDLRGMLLARRIFFATSGGVTKIYFAILFIFHIFADAVDYMQQHRTN